MFHSYTPENVRKHVLKGYRSKHWAKMSWLAHKSCTVFFTWWYSSWHLPAQSWQKNKVNIEILEQGVKYVQS